jgi:hypothetical protein
LAFVGLLLRDSWQHWFASDFVGIIAVATVTAFFQQRWRGRLFTNVFKFCIDAFAKDTISAVTTWPAALFYCLIRDEHGDGRLFARSPRINR